MLDQYTKKWTLLIKRVIDQWVLPLSSKVYKRVIHEQVSNYFGPFFNEILCGFRKTHCTQHASFELLTSWQTSLSRGGFAGSILVDLSKAYDRLKDNLLLAKLQVYGFSENLWDFFQVI